MIFENVQGILLFQAVVAPMADTFYRSTSPISAESLDQNQFKQHQINNRQVLSKLTLANLNEAR